MEKCVAAQIHHHLFDNKLFEQFKYLSLPYCWDSFCKYHCNAHWLTNFNHTVYDLSTTFNSISDNILLDELFFFQNYRYRLFIWFRPCNVTAGVPQGSLLGPILLLSTYSLLVLFSVDMELVFTIILWHCWWLSVHYLKLNKQ